MDSFSLLWLIPVLPLIGAAFNGLLGKRLPKAAVGLAIVISLFRHKESLNPDSFASLKW